MSEVGSLSTRRALVSIAAFVLIRAFLCGSIVNGNDFKEQCIKTGKTRQEKECTGKLYFLTEDLARSAQLPVNSRVCRYHWDEIRRQNSRCSCPREEWVHSENLHPHPIPARLYAVFDSVGATMHWYRPGTRWCYSCKTTSENLFKSHTLYRPPRQRTISKREQPEKQGHDEQSSKGQELQRIWKFTGSPILHLHENLQQAQTMMESENDELSLVKKLKETKCHFTQLFTRLQSLAEICGIELQGETTWEEIETAFGTIKITSNGDVMIDNNVWNQMAEAFNKLNKYEEWSFDQMVERFQLAMYHHYNSEDPTTLYSPATMKAFAEVHAPGLYNLILKSILRDDSRLRKEHCALQEQRTVVLLHTMAYFRSQKTCTLQKDEGLFLQQHGASRPAINSGRVLGYSTSPRDVDGHKRQLINNYPTIVKHQIMNATQGGYLMINLLDDFHNILTVRLPTNLKLSVATHMASSLIDIHPTVPAVELPSNRGKQHSQAKIASTTSSLIEKTCRGGIISEYVQKMFNDNKYHTNSTYMEKQEQQLLSMHAMDIQHQLKELRVYSGLSHDELCTLDTTVLIDEFEQPLRSMEDYKKALSHILECAPDLTAYLKKFALPAPGDWPTWYYEKKMIAQEQNENSALLSLIPEQGPFHVFLNVQEDVLKMYHFILAKVYRNIFGSELATKPKPFQIHLLITAVFLGWLKIRSKVLQKFKLCKDIEFACLLHLLEEVIPLSFYHYPVTFRSGNLDSYIVTMLRLAVLFIIWKRKHYDRSTISMLSDLCYHKLFFPTYYDLKKLWMVLVTEKKVEIWNGVLRSNIQKHDTAQEIQSKATTIAASKSKRSFLDHFVHPYTRGYSEKDLSTVTGKAAEVLLSFIKTVGQNLGKSKQIPQDTNARGQPKGEPKFYLPTFDANVDTKALPLAYTHIKADPRTIPNVSKICDYKECQVTDTSAEAIRLACFHTIHTTCHNLAGHQCPICTPHLSKTINKIAAAFNASLLTPTASSSTPSPRATDNDDNDGDDNINLNSNTIDPAYYQSTAWESRIDNELRTFQVIQPQTTNSTTTSQQPRQPVHVTSIHVGSLVFWFLPHQLSQATLFGRNGSNACTIIALFLAKSFLTNRDALQVDARTPLTAAWISMFISSMARGNQIYDNITQGSDQAPFFSVAEANAHLRPLLGSAQLEDTLDLSITCTDPLVPQSSLAFYLPRLNTERNTAGIVIMNGMTVCFVGRGGKIHIMDSHPHGPQFGAMIGMTPMERIEDFLAQIKQQISPNFNVCSLTFVSF